MAQVPVPPQLQPWLCPQGVLMLQQYVGVVRAALDRVMAMQVGARKRATEGDNGADRCARMLEMCACVCVHVRVCA